MTLIFKYPPLFVNLILFLSVSLVASQDNNLDSLVGHLKESASGILFGDIWGFDEYCGLKRTDERILHEDAEIQNLFNGTKLESLVDASWPEAAKELKELTLVALRARETLPIACAINSWGYADTATELLANGYHTDDITCSRDIDLLIEFASAYVSGNYFHSRFHRKTEETKNDEITFNQFDLELWLQLNAFARLPSGLPFKSHLWLGDYDGCLETGERLKKSKRTNGTRYCYGQFGWPLEGAASRNTGFQLGLCLPKSCSSISLVQSKEYLRKLDTLIKLNSQLEFVVPLIVVGNNRSILIGGQLSFNYTNGLELLDIYCPPVDESELRRFIPTSGKPASITTTTIINSFLLLALPLIWISAYMRHFLAGRDNYCTGQAKKSASCCCWTVKDDIKDKKVTIEEKAAEKATTPGGEKLKTMLIDNGQLPLMDNNQVQPGTSESCSSSRQKDELTTIDCESKLEKLSTRQQSVWRSFSLGENLKDFVRTNDPVERLAGLNAIKVLTMNWLVLDHIYLLMMAYSSNLQAYRERVNILGVLILNGQHGVPPFFMISGLLFGYKFFSEQNSNNNTTKYSQMIIKRYLRFAPMYLLCYAYIKQFSHLVGSGPLWDYGVSRQSDSRQCQNESWLVPTLMLANFIPPFVQCIITGWHIANDVQIILLLPLMFYIYGKSRYLGRLFALASIAFTHYTHAFLWGRATNYDFATISMEPILFGARVVTDRASLDYVNPLGRMGTYFMGVLLADLLFAKDQGHERAARVSRLRLGSTVTRRIWRVSNLEDVEKATKKRKFFKGRTLAIWASGLILQMIVPFMAPTKLLSLIVQHSLAKHLAYPFVRFSVELGWFILFYCLLREKTKSRPQQAPKKRLFKSVLIWFGHILRLPFWNVLAKLNYCIMLTHFTILRWMVQYQRQLFQFNWMNYMQFTLFYLLVVYAANLLIHLLVEIPLNRLTKKLEVLLFHSDNRNNNKPS